jgi:hypothetical protein
VAAAIETRRRDAVMWTITLPGDAFDALAAVDGWPVFQDSVRRLLRRCLRLAKLRGELVGVVELQPQRTRAERRPCPHLHIAYVGKRPGRRVWALHTSMLDGIIRRSLAAAGVHGIDLRAAGQVEPIRCSVAGYLSKYMAKGGPLEECIERQLELVPRQWWLVSSEGRQLAESFRFAVPIRFVLWMIERHHEGVCPAGASVARLAIPDARAPATWGIDFAHPDAFGRALVNWRQDPDGQVAA